VDAGSEQLWASDQVKMKRAEIRDLIHHLAAEQELAKQKAAKEEEEAKQREEEEQRKKAEEEEEKAKAKFHPLGPMGGLVRSKKKQANPQRGPVPNDKTNPEVID
jgi:septal ring factor EnvC (AmiA/AmiB activator)